jgi:hypothetical protein
MGDTTPNYGFFMPSEEDSMADVAKNITDNFEILGGRGNPTVIPAGGALPQSGNYNLFDMVYRDDPKDGFNWPSAYLLVCKDADWGWHWRPIQAITSPWVTVPSTAIVHTSFEQHPTSPVQIALDSRGWCHWRGRFRQKTVNIASATTFVIFKTLPLGLRPPFEFNHTVALSPIRSAAGKAGNVSGRMFLREDGYNSFRFFNSNSGSQNIWLDGLHYNTAYSWYYNA